MKELVDYIIEKDLYDMIIYSSDGENITPIHMNYLKQGLYTIIHNHFVETENHPHRTHNKKGRIIHIQTSSRAMEIWIDEDLFKTTQRDLKINKLLASSQN
jgi:hypothetical protein